MTTPTSVVIVGGGPAGYTAGLYAARAGLRPVVLAGYAAGGQLMQTTEVDNFPGFPAGILGPELMAAMRLQAERFGARVAAVDVTRVELNPSGDHLVDTSQETFQTPVVIVATGATARMLNVPGEDVFLGRGVATCAVCDGAHFKGQRVAVVGGGDSALEEVLQLARLCREVHLLHRRDALKASKIMQDRVRALPQVHLHWNTEVLEVVGQQGLQALKLRDTVSGEVTLAPFDGLFVAIGHTPNTELFVGQLPMNRQGYLETVGGESRTSVPGVFVAGDVFDFQYRQAVTAAASGCKAALEAERYLSLQAALEKEALSVR